MAERKLLINGIVFKRTDGRWNGVVWYMDEAGKRKRKSFSTASKTEVTKRMRDYIFLLYCLAFTKLPARCPGKGFYENTAPTYRTIDDVPDWGRPYVQALIDRGTLRGPGRRLDSQYQAISGPHDRHAPPAGRPGAGGDGRRCSA